MSANDARKSVIGWCTIRDDSRFTRAPAPLMRARPAISSRSIGWPEIGKFSTARCVWARHLRRRAPAPRPSSPFDAIVVLIAHSGAPMFVDAGLTAAARAAGGGPAADTAAGGCGPAASRAAGDGGPAAGTAGRNRRRRRSGGVAVAESCRCLLRPPESRSPRLPCRTRTVSVQTSPISEVSKRIAIIALPPRARPPRSSGP